MKKLMIAAAIVCVAAVSHAAKATWSTGNCYYNGVGSELKTAGTGGYAAGDAYLFILTADQYDSITSGDAAALWDKFTANGTSSTLNFGETLGSTTVRATKALGGTGSAAFTGTQTGDFGEGNVYAAWIITHKDKDGAVDAYSANTFYAIATISALTGTANTALGWGEKATGTATTWQAVPEPTSGLLLLLGVAGLALRRRRA